MNIFTKHPNSVDESYVRHMASAFGLGTLLLFSSMFQFIHAIFPFIHPPFGTDIFPFIHPPFGTDVKGISNVVIKRALKTEKRLRGENS